MSSALKSLARAGLRSFGGLHAVRWWTRAGVRILGYHAFPREDRPWLEWQCAWVRRHFEPVSMRAIAESLEAGKPLPANALAVTVDDGFADFFETGYPVFKAHGIPATVFLVSDFLDRRIWLWWLHILWVFRHSSASVFEWNGRRFVLDSKSARDAAAEHMMELAKSMPNTGRLALCGELADILSVRLPPEPPPEWLPMSWDQVRELHREGVEFGGHTKTHPILSRVEDPTEMREEIVGSKRRIEEELGTAVEHFAYPNGRWQDIGEAVDQTVRAAGFRTAVTFEAGLNHQPDRYLLQRLGAYINENHHQFAEIVSGLHHISRR